MLCLAVKLVDQNSFVEPEELQASLSNKMAILVRG